MGRPMEARKSGTEEVLVSYSTGLKQESAKKSFGTWNKIIMM